MVSAAVVSPRAVGGVKYIIERLLRGLKREGIFVREFAIDHGLFVSDVADLRLLSELHRYDVIIFMGSIPPLFHVFIKNDIKLLLFVHGFVYHESLATLTQGSFKARVGTLYSLARFEFTRKIDRIDAYVCHSVTTCEANRLKRYILLPQFVFPEEFRHYGDESRAGKKIVRILSYTSYVNSPRLLREDTLILLMKQISKMISKRIEFIIINPMGRSFEWRNVNLVVRRLPFLPRNRFLALLATADLWIEECIDEELRMSSLDAGLVGTPVAKLVHPFFVERQDYTDEVLWAQTPREFINVLVDYISDIENKRYVYSRKYREFLLSKRSWDSVKHGLLNVIRTSA